MIEQAIVITVIVVSLILFVQAKLRYDIVAMLALLVITLTGITPAESAFSGFAHPAIITVAAVLVVSRGLLNVGAMDPITDLVNKLKGGIEIKLLLLMGITAFFSSFMNNVGALALVMPVAIKIGKDNNLSPSYLLMPIAYASLFGGLITEIGTPPNLIISKYRDQYVSAPFNFLDFAPVGLILTIVGILFVSLIGYKLIPNRRAKADPNMLFKVEDYLSELVVPEGNKFIGKSIRDLSSIQSFDVNILSIVRNKVNIIAPHAQEILEAGDLLVVRIDPSELAKLIDKTGMMLKGAKLTSDESGKILTASEHSLIEIVLRDDSPLIGNTAKEIKLRNEYNVNLVAISRQGVYLRGRLGEIHFRTGDIMLIQVADQNKHTVLSSLKGLPLAGRGIEIGTPDQKRRRAVGLGIFGFSILMTTLGMLPVQISFTMAAVLLVLTKIITLKEIYESIDWPVIVMLGAMLPLGDAIETTGAADTIANLILGMDGMLSPAMIVGLLMLVTMLLTNLINNAAAAVLMAPIGVSLAVGLGVSVDPMLMAVAVASSCAYMTPIGHQSNTLIMGPGGYRFGDYWRMGLPVTIIFLIIGTPLILFFWPL
jgi:di/tricarboxylate transporter